MGDEAAWQVGRDRYLAIQTCEDGYDYTLFDKEFHEIDGGQVDNPELSMLEARAEILEEFGLQMRELRAVVYEDVMEQSFGVDRRAEVVELPVERKSVVEQLQTAEKFASPGKAPHMKLEMER